MDASVISRSQSVSQSTAAGKDLIEGTYGALDVLFPIYEQMVKLIHIPAFLNFLTLIIFTVQVFTQSLWGRKLLVLTSNSIDDKIIRFLYEYFLLNSATNHYDINFIGFYIVIGVFAFSLLIFFGLFIQYKLTISFNKPLLYIYRGYFDVVVPCFILPSIYFAGQFLIGVLLKELPFIDILLSVVSAIIAVTLFILYYYHFSLLSGSPYLGRGPFVTVQSKYHTDFFLVTFIFVIISYLLELFPKWASIIGCIAEASVFIYFAYRMSVLPYFDFKSNPIFAGIYTSLAIVNIVQVIQGFYQISDAVPLIAFPVFFVISIIIYFLSYREMKNKIKQLLNELPPERDSLPVMSDELDNLYLDASRSRFYKFLIVSVESAHDIFLNNIIFKYGFERYNDFETSRLLLIYGSFIPSFNRIVSMGYSHFFKSAKLSFVNRFLIYTILRLMTMRQSSSSQQFSQRVIEVRQMSKKCRDFMKGFLLQTPTKVSTFYTFFKETQNTEYRWIELINHYPNSSKVYDEYGDFLIEVLTDFRESTTQKHKTRLLEEGHRLHKDYVFINFIHWFQHYLKRDVVDLHGKIVHKIKTTGNGSQNSSKGSSNASTLTSLTQLMEIAPEEEEFYAKSMFAQHKLRLAFQRSMEEKRSSCAKPLKICLFLILTFSVAVLVASNVLVDEFFAKRSSSLTKVKNLNYARFYTSCSRFASYLYYAINNGYYHITDSYRNKAIKDVGLSPYISFTDDLRNQSLYYNGLSEDYYNQFIANAVEYAMEGHHVYQVFAPFLEQELEYHFCDKEANILNGSVHTNVHALFSYNSIVNNIIYALNVSTWGKQKVLCNTISSIPVITEGLDDFNLKELSFESEDTADNTKLIQCYEIAFPLVLFFVNIALFLTPLISYYFTLKKILNVLQQINPKIKEEATKPIGKQSSEDNGSIQPPESMIFMWVFMFGVLSLFVAPIFSFVVFNESKVVNKIFESLIGWMNVGGARGPLLSEAMEHMILASLAKSGAFAYLNADKQMEMGDELVSKAMDFHEIVVEGTADTQPCIGFDDKLDELHFVNICNADQESQELHERYRCTSLSQTFGFVKSITDDVLTRFDEINSLDDPIYLEAFHAMNTHMFRRLFDVAERIDYLGTSSKEKFDILSTVLVAIGIILSILIFIGHMYIAYQLDYMFHTAMRIFRRIPPLLITQNNVLMDFLLNRHRKNGNESMYFSQNIIFSSQNGVMLVNKSGIIEMINNSVADILGYVPDQILGQQASVIFAEKDANRIQQQLVLMHNGEAKDVFDDRFDCTADDGSVKQCHVTILALASQGTEINTYVFFIEDESQIILKQEQAETAKKKSEELLFQILPRDIVFKLNQGEKDITFTVPSATIMFIDIVRFSDYAANLTPQQIMGNLSLIFDTFDKNLTQYDMITKIKLIGDVYMCAAGLFNPESQPAEHAQQMLKFAIDCLGELENINVRLESMLAVRIGVNTGGPIIGGILGTDKPVFDIIGDPINVAARLQSTDIPGKVQIPQSVYDLVQKMDFEIEKRGEVFLKGKGNVMTYLVSPINIFNMASTNITSSMMIRK